MAKEVKVSIIIDDNGSMRLTEKSAQKLGASMDKVSTSARRADRAIKGSAQTATASGKNFGKQASVISGGLVPAYATLAATIFAASAAFNFLKSAGDLKVLQEGQIAYTATTGIAMKTLTKDIRGAAQGLLDFETAAQAAAIGVASGLSAQQVTQLAEGAANVSKILGRDVTDSFNRLVRGVTKAEPELLDELGIILRLDDAAQKYATSLNVNANSLSQFQKRTAVFNDVQDQLEQKFNRINKILQPENNAFSELGIAFADVLKVFKELLASFATPFARFFTRNVDSLAAALGLLAIPLFKQMIPGFTQWGEAAEEAGMQAQAAVDKTYARIEKINKRKRELIPSTPTQAARTSALEAGLRGRRGSGLEKLIQGTEELTKRQIDGMRRAAVAGAGEYGKMGEEMRASFIKNLDEMKAGAKTTSAAVADDLKRASKTAMLNFDLLAVRAEAAFFRIKKSVIEVTGALVRLANTAIKIVSVVGLVSIAFDLLKSGLSLVGIELTRSTPELDKLLAATEALIDRQSELNKEYDKFAKVQATIASDLAGPGAAQFQAAGQAVAALSENFEELQVAIDRGIKAEKSAIDVSNSYFFSTLRLIPGLKLVGKGLEEAFFRDTRAVRQGTKARQELLRSAGRINEVLLSTKLTYTDLGLELSKLATRQANDEKLNEKEVARYIQLTKIISENGQEFAQLIQIREANRASVSKAITGVTQFKTSVSDLLDELDKQLVLEEKLYSKSPTSANKQKIDSLKEEINLIQQINDLEVKFANKRLANQFNQNLLLNKSVKISQQRLGLEFKKKNLGTDIEELEAKLNLGQEDGIKFSKDKLAQLRQQKGVKQQEVKLAEKELELLKESLVLQNQIGRAQNYFNQLRAESSPLNDELLGFESRRSELVARRAKAIQDVAEATSTTSKEELTRLEQIRDGYTAQIMLLERDERIRKDRLRLSNSLTAVENRYAKLLSGRTPFERARLNNLKQEELNNERIADLERQRREIGASGDQLKYQQLTNQIEAFRIQNELLVEQEMLAFKVADTFRNTLESSLSENLANIIKGTEKSFKDALLNIAKSVLNSIADTLAQSLTEDILGSLGLYNSPAGKMREALQEGGDYVKEKIQEGFGVSAQSTSGKVSTTIKTAAKENTTEEAVTTETFFSKISGLFSNITSIFSNLFSGLISTLGNIGGGFLGSIFSGIFGAAAGGIMPGGVTGYANGGIVKRPTLGLVGEGKMNEAVVPLPDGKAIPVNMNGNANTNNVTVNVSMDSSGNAQSQSQSDGQQGADMGKLIAGAVQEELQRQKRPGGILSPYGAA